MTKPHLHPPFLSLEQWHKIRNVALNSAAILFVVDSVHVALRHFPACDGLYCSLREPLLTWASLAAVLIVYYDDAERRDTRRRLDALEAQEITPPALETDEEI